MSRAAIPVRGCTSINEGYDTVIVRVAGISMLHELRMKHLDARQLKAVIVMRPFWKRHSRHTL